MGYRRAMRPRSIAGLVTALAVVLFSGCYGSTGFVSELGATSATLNGRGTTNNGPADVSFEYWKTATPGAKQSTPAKRIPGDVTGPFSVRVAGLDRDTSYSYRLCGKDVGGATVCAQTETFVTGRSSVRASGNAYVPYGETGFYDIGIVAFAAPAPETPGGRGRATVYNQEAGPPGGITFPIGSSERPNITCVVISGNRAVVGFRQDPPFSDSIPVNDQAYAFLLDGGPGLSGDRFSLNIYTGSFVPPADCPAFPDPATLKALTGGDIDIRDLSAAPSAR